MVGREDLSDHMKNFAENNDFLKQPQRMLIGSLSGTKVLLFSDLLRWYLKHGLKVTRIYQVIEYTPRQVYKQFGESVSDARRLGDRDIIWALLASTNKLIGNSAYGKTITDKEKHALVKYIDGAYAASLKVRSKRFISLEEIGEDYYEVCSRKLRVNQFFLKLFLLCTSFFSYSIVIYFSR